LLLRRADKPRAAVPSAASFITDQKEAGMAQAKKVTGKKTAAKKTSAKKTATSSTGSKLASTLSKNKKPLAVAGVAAAAAAAAGVAVVAVKRRKSAGKATAPEASPKPSAAKPRSKKTSAT
jgi:hypothetical protein